MKRIPIALLTLLMAALPVRAQHGLADHGPYDPAVPTPASVLGYELGERFTPHFLIDRYVTALAEASPRIRMDTVAFTHEGRPVLLAIATSEANQARLDGIQADARRLADPRGASRAELDALVERTPTVVWLAYTVHGDEASGVEAALATLYQLAAGRDDATLAILENVVTLVDPVQNPDGHDRHVHQVAWDRGAFGPDPFPGAVVHDHDWHGARTNHYLFDLNRDWIVHSQPETRGRMEVLRSWFPHVAVDLHEMGSSSTYFFPPPMDPIHQSIHPLVHAGWELFAEGNARAFSENGWGFFTREGFDEFYPGYGPSWPIHTGAIGMTYEQASSEGGAIERPDGTILTLREATLHHYTASRATLRTAATNRAGRVRDFLTFRLDAVSQARRDPMRTVLLRRDDQGRADTLVTVLLRHEIEVGRLTREARVDATAYGESDDRATTLPAGSYVIDLAQPQGVLARTLLEPETALDPDFVAEELERREAGLRDRFYDMTGWALPYLFRVDASWTGAEVGPTEPVDAVPTAEPAPPPEAGYGYAFRPGSEASLRMLAGLLRDGVRVRHAPRSFTVEGHAFPHGAFLVLVRRNPDLAVHDVVRKRAAETGTPVVAIDNALVDRGTDLGSNSVEAIPQPRVALVGGEGISSYSYGAAWHTFDTILRYPANRVELGDLTRSLEEFDVVVIPSAYGLGSELGERGTETLERWVRGGGTLITLDGATAWLASEDGLARLRQQEEPEAVDGVPPSMSVPGAILRARTDTLSPLVAGVREPEIPVMLFGSRVYEAPADREPGEVAIRYADRDRLRLAGYLWPEVPDRVAGTPYLWTEEVGSGRLIAFTGDPNFRAMWRGLVPLFANAVFLGGTF
ncbi:MAG: M14 family zinc carboxypeptidase [Longimicrobiales bacterium]|nr:M14 family zinc carboxypeptidase [Longimicrobiales bacterium]